MKLALFAALALCLSPALAQTIPTTPHLGLGLPPASYQPYNVPLNNNFSLIDTWAGTVPTTGVLTNTFLQNLPNCLNATYVLSPQRGTCVPPGGGVTLPSITNIFKGNGSGGAIAALAGVDFALPQSCPLQNATNICITAPPYNAVGDGATDNTAVFLAAIAALNTQPSCGTIWGPSGTYLVGGPLLDPGGANAVLPVPKIANYTNNYCLISFRGYQKPVGDTPATGFVIKFTNTTGNSIGGYDSVTGGGFPPFTNVWLDFQDVTLIGPANPGSVMINASSILDLTYRDLLIETTGSSLPTNAAGVAIKFPSLANGVRLVGEGAFAESGYYTAIMPGEHTHITHAAVSHSVNCVVADSGANVGAPSSYRGNTLTIDYLWCGPGTNGIMAGTHPTAVHISTLDLESVTGNGVNDPSNLLHGIINFNVPFPFGGMSYCNLNASGGANLQINALWCIPQYSSSIVPAQAVYKICGDVSAGSGCVPTSSTTVYDASGNGNNGTWHGTQSGTTNWYSASTPEAFAGTFDGSTDFIQTTYTPSSITNFTVAAWIKTPVNPAAQFPISTRVPGAANGIVMLTTTGTGGNVNLVAGFMNSGSQTLQQTSNGLGAPGSWHCIAMTHVAGASSVSIYIDGTSGGSSIASAATDPGNAGPLYIGQDGTNSPLNAWDGLINDVRFYNTVLAHGSISGCI
jgi:hypothetical protein